ncbi:MAG: cupin domain-containing protein [Gammaproteobacteria bacterium]|nr:MAG: cupin domain-containing protein [Gammaproteobacteria bacterium]
MKKRYSLDPENSGQAQKIESALLEGLEPLQPSEQQRATIRARLFQRIHASAAAESPRVTIRSHQGQWRKILPGVHAKLLDRNNRAFLLDIEPGASLPMHRHHEDEECIVLRGSASLGDLKVNTGDYHMARAGSRHGKISSASGALLYLRGIPVGHTAEVARDFLSALLPGDGRELITIRASEGAWSDLAPGVASKALYDDGQTHSSLVRIAAGSQWTSQQTPLAHDEECLLLEGDAFFGDTLLHSGDWQLAPTGAESRPVSSDHGALVFMRGARNAA